ncbi:MAG: nicotinate (nicotinamide) nucleotide adenylyltransferase [Gemmatimonadota bacterium]|nr:nicotinate (nicotinamide) nucleotide adenylyltransferase [Gemmatimonadota bacterium]
MTPAARIGVFGGAFDPPHVGHVIVAQEAVELLGLDRLLVVPTARPPHRDVYAKAAERLEVTRLAFAPDRRFEVSDIELRRDGPSWTVDTLEAVGAERRPAELTLIMGVDQYRAFRSWRDPRRIASLARLAVLARRGEEPDADPEFPCRVLPVTRVDVSSTLVRRRISEGRSIRWLVPEDIRGRVLEIWKRNVNSGEVHGDGRGRSDRPNAGDGC